MKTIQISKTVLQTLYGGCPESINEVFSEYLRTWSSIKEDLLAGYNSGRIDSLKKILHYHGPTFMYLGMPLISDFIKILEGRCKGFNDATHLSADFSILLEMINQSKLLITNELNSMRSIAA